MEDSAASLENIELEKRYECEHCSFTSEFHSELVRHNIVHSDSQTFLSNVSDTSEDANLEKGTSHSSTPVSSGNNGGNNNTNNNGDEDKRRLFHCDSCSFSSPFRSKIVSHCVVHSDVRPFICDLCDYAAKRKYDLKKHMHFKHKVYQSGFNLPLPSQPSGDNSSVQYVSNNPYPINDQDSPLATAYSNETLNSKNILSVKTESNSNEDDCYIIDEGLTVQDSFHNASMLTLSNLGLAKQGASIHDIRELPISKSLLSSGQQNTMLTEVTVSGPGLNKNNSRFFPPRPTGLFSNVDLTLGQTPPQSHESMHSPPVTGAFSLTKDAGVTSATAETSSHSATTVSSSNITETAVGTSRSFTCPHCNILYFDNALYVMHMGLHDPDNPWQCNLCGDTYHDVYSFTSHFINQHRH